MGVIFENGFFTQPNDQSFTFTLTSSDITNGYGNFNSWDGHEYPTALGTNGVDGFNVTFHAGQPSYIDDAANMPYSAQINNQTIVDFFYNLVINNMHTKQQYGTFNGGLVVHTLLVLFH
jgi:hypothetical protein